MGPRDHLNPCDAPDPATIRTSVRRAIRLENEAAAARRRRPSEVRATRPPVPTSATIVPEDGIAAETLAAEFKKERATREKGTKIAPARPSLRAAARPESLEETVILEELPSVDSEPSLGDLDLELRPARKGLWALAGGLMGISIVAVLAAVVAALVFGAQQTSVPGAFREAQILAVPPAAAPAAATEASPARPAPKSRRTPRPAAVAEIHPPAEAPVAAAPVEVAPVEVAPSELAPAEVAPSELAPAEVAPAEAALSVEAVPEADHSVESISEGDTTRPPPPTATLRPKAEGHYSAGAGS